jgi:hypothetical protein
MSGRVPTPMDSPALADYQPLMGSNASRIADRLLHEPIACADQFQRPSASSRCAGRYLPPLSHSARSGEVITWLSNRMAGDLPCRPMPSLTCTEFAMLAHGRFPGCRPRSCHRIRPGGATCLTDRCRATAIARQSASREPPLLEARRLRAREEGFPYRLVWPCWRMASRLVYPAAFFRKEHPREFIT